MKHLIILFFSICLFVPISAQETIITAALAAEEVSDLIDRAKNSASTLLGEAESRGSALLNQAGNELNVLAANAAILFGNEMNKTVDQLSTENQQLMVRIDRMSNDLDRFLNQDVYDLKDAVAIDLTQALSGIPFYDDKLFISRVSGLTHINKSDGFYELDIIGTNLGLGDNKVSSKIDIEIDSEIIDDFVINRSERNKSQIKIPVSYLNDSTEVSTKKLNLLVEFKVKKRFLFLIPYKKKVNFEVPISISVLPNNAGNFNAEFTVSIFGWEKERTEIIDRSTGNHHCSSSCGGEPTRTRYTIPYRVSRSNTTPPTPGDRKLQNIRLSCVAGPCGAWNQVMSRGISDNSTYALAQFDVWSHPTTWRMQVDVHQYREVQEKVINVPNSTNYNKLIKIETPDNYKYGKIIYTSYSNRKVEFVLGTEDGEGLVSLQSIQNLNGGKKVYFYTVNKPI